MRVCFVLPKFTRQPIGGYKMVFEYANRLVERGHAVKIVFLNDTALQKFKIPKTVKKMVANYLTQKEPTWFEINSKIEKISNQDITYRKKIKDIDVAIATAVETVEFVQEEFGNKRKCYYIQDFETWRKDEKYLYDTYASGMRNIVISSWLKELVDKYSEEPSILIKNPIDLNVYKVNEKIENRKKHTIGLLYHEGEHKGLVYAMEALYKLKDMYDDLEVKMFGIPPKPEDLPEWITYTRGASRTQTVEIYNNIEIFICATVEEGYGLTGLEAMACGAALVSTSYKGVMEYAEHKKNALLSAVKNVDELVENVKYLFDNNDERIAMAKRGVESVQNFSWDMATDVFESVVIGN